VITVFRAMPGKPRRDDLDLAALYAGYAASAIERDRLLDEVTARNRLLETIREMLQTLAGPVPTEAALRIALQALRHGLGADEVALVAAALDGPMLCRGYSSAPVDWQNGAWRGGAGLPPGAGGLRPDRESADLGVPDATLTAVNAVLDRADPDGVAVTGQASLGTLRTGGGAGGGRYLSVTFGTPDGRTVLLAGWRDGTRSDDATDLLEDAANSLRLALERERALLAQQEAMALRQSRELQRTFLRRLSHELRTPLTAITGYATSLLQQDVTWDPTRRSGSCPASPPSQRGSAAWSTTCSTSPRSSRASCGSTATGATSPSSSTPRSPSCHRRPPPRSRWRYRPAPARRGCPPSGPTTTGWSRCSSTCSATRSATTRRGRR
jgi:signal transduction histidine kinase